MAPLLSIKNLEIKFNERGQHATAVKNISFNVMPGELLAIVGESGSGKSITALSILRLLPTTATVTGQIIFNKHTPIDILQLPGNKIAGIRGNEIAMIFQEPMTSLNPVFTCGYQVMEVIRVHQQVNKTIAREKTIELFKQVQLPNPEEILNRYPHEISGGQKQRVMIAMAMSCSPSLLIADEPTTALDVTVQKTILELIKSLQQQNNMAVIFITHDLGVVADIADKIVVMYKGEIAEQGDARKILLSPQHPYSKALIACRPAGKQKGTRLPVVSDFLVTQPSFNETTENIVTTNKNLANDKPKTNILEVKNLTVSFPAKKNFFGKPTRYFNAVDNVSFAIQQGDIVGLVGESGCGKTTLGRCILQLIKPSAGNIILDGRDITAMKPATLRHIRKDLQIVFQDPFGSLNPRITIGEAILEPLKVHAITANNKQRKEKVMELLQKVSLETSHYNRYPHQFSGGQRQRICIARALALNPSFLIFDESVSALDVSVQAQVLNLLNDLKAEFGFTSIFISHDLSVVHYICNRIIVMNKGAIEEEGMADDIYFNPKREYTKKLLEAIPGKSLLKF